MSKNKKENKKSYFAYSYFQSEEMITELIFDKFAHKGFACYFKLIEITGRYSNSLNIEPDHVMDFLVKKLKVTKEELLEYIKFFVDIGAFSYNSNNNLQSSLIIEHFENIAERSKIYAGNRLGKTKDKTETFDKTKIEDYEGSFPPGNGNGNNPVNFVPDDQPAPEIDNSKNPYKTIFEPRHRQHLDLFVDKCTDVLNKIPEFHYLKYDHEKEALGEIYNLINNGLFDQITDMDILLDPAFKKVVKGNPNFYMVGLNNAIIQIIQADLLNTPDEELKALVKKGRIIEAKKSN